jgi:hypothetical protein
MIGLEKINIEQLVTFIFHRQKEDGGFAACPSLPSTVADTFYSLNIFVRLDALGLDLHLFSRIDKEKLLDFIKAYATIRESLPLRIRFFLFAIERYILGDAVTYEDHCKDINSGKMVSYENYYYLSRLTSGKKAGFHVKELDLSDCTCKDVYYFVLSFPDVAQSRADEIVDWLKKCQNCDGGFGFFPGTTSYMEYCDYSLSALAVLKKRPAHHAKAERYIRYCQTGAGGFSRGVKAAPFLEASFHAVHALLSLDRVVVPDLEKLF